MADFGINWGLGVAPDVGGAFTQGFQNGQAARRENDTRNALAAYAQSPDMQTANALIAVDPRLGMQARQQQMEIDKQRQMQELTARAVKGDHTALEGLAGLDPNLYMKLDDRTRERVKMATAFIGNAVQDVTRLPEEQRAAAWASYVQRAEASGLDIPTQYERYSPEALNAAAAEAGVTEKIIKAHEPQWMAVPQGGYLENVNQYSRSTPLQASPAQQAPGGIPALPPGFELEGGPTQPASAGFRP